MAAKPYGNSLPVTTANAPAAVLSWLIRFEVMDQVAASNGISVTQAQSQAALSSLSAVATQAGASSTSMLLIANGVPPQLFPQVGQWEAQQTAYGLKASGGKAPTSTAEQNAFTAAVNKAQCTTADSLNIQISPQFGRLRLSRSHQLDGRGPGLTDHLGGMLLGKPQQRLDPEPGTRTGAALPQLALHGGQLTLQRLDLFPVPADPVRQLPDVLVHLMAVIAAERHLENPQG